MKLSMNQATCLEKSSLEKDLELCEKYGYDMIEPRTMDGIPNYLKNHTIDELAAWFKSHKVKPLAFNTLCFFNNRTPEDYQKVLQELRQMCEWGKKIGCKTIITVPTVDLKKVTRQDIHKSAVKCLKEMGAIDMDNVGITLDCFHFHGMGSKLEDLAKADGKKIFIVHLNDTEDFPIGSLLDEDRVWPGDGCIDLDAIFQTLKKIGWQEDVVSLELFRPEYYKMDPEDVYRIGKEKSEAVIKRNF